MAAPQNDNGPGAPFTQGFMPAQRPQFRLEDLQTPRGQHIPSWYNAAIHFPLDDAGRPYPDGPARIQVKSHGLPLLGMDGKPFSVAEVPVERRFAIASDGEVIDQSDFEAQYLQRIEEFYQLKKLENPDVRYDGSVKREPVPNVVHYVTQQINPEDETQVFEMHYDPYKTRGSKPKTLAGQNEDEDLPYMEALVLAYMNPASRKKMRPAEISEVEEHLAGLMSDETIPTIGDKKPPMGTMPCGDRVPNLQSKSHQEDCLRCQKALEEDGGS